MFYCFVGVQRLFNGHSCMYSRHLLLMFVSALFIIYLMPFAAETPTYILHEVIEHPCFRSSLILHRFVEGWSPSWLTLGESWAWMSDVTGLTIVLYVTPSTIPCPLVNCDIFRFFTKKFPAWALSMHRLWVGSVWAWEGAHERSVGPRAADEEMPASRVWAPATAHILLSEARGVKKRSQL